MLFAPLGFSRGAFLKKHFAAFGCMLWFFVAASSAAAAPLAVVDSPTVPAYSSNLTNTTAKTSTAETNTAADAPLAEASDGRQRPWWERLSEKHRELHKGQSWCVVGSTHTRPCRGDRWPQTHSSALCHHRLQQHRVTLEASRGGAHARFTTLAPQTLSEPMAAAHRACEACLLRSVRRQTMLHVAPCATLTGHLFPFAGCCAMRHPLRGGQPQWPHARRRILAQCALAVTPPISEALVSVARMRSDATLRVRRLLFMSLSNINMVTSLSVHST